MKTATVRIEFDPDTKTYGATSEDLPDIYAISDDRNDVLRRFVRSANVYRNYLRERNQPIPATLSANAEIVTITIEAA